MAGKQNPYRNLPDPAFWRRSVAGVAFDELDPVTSFSLSLSPETKVATAGSCFAQHIARHLSAVGLNYYVAEQGHPILSETVRKRQGFGVYSARYGNIYTARQLTQLFRRAYGHFTPLEDAWKEAEGRVRDPFRPSAQPDGFVSIEEMRRDRAQHFAAVRRMFETLDVFVFTLGLTECWISKQDGAAFPLCPGVEGGRFDEAKHQFYNQTVDDVTADMTRFIDDLKTVNPAARVVLTVSPVPLAATAVPGAHVLTSTTYSKSVLRVAAEQLVHRFPHVQYFPSYEIITGAYNRGRYYADDLRNATEEGVTHVMRLFLKHATAPVAATTVGPEQPAPNAAEPAPAPAQAPAKEDFQTMAASFVEVECDEMLLDATNAQGEK